MKKRVFALILVLVLCACTAMPAFAAEEKAPCVLDLAGLLTESEADALETRLEAIADKFSVQVAILTMPTCDGEDHEAYAKNFYREAGYGLGENKDGILLLIDMDEDNRGWAIYGKALGADAMTSSVIESVGEDMTPDLKDGNYADAFDTFAERCEERIDIAINGEPFDPVWTLIVCLVVSLLLALIITGVMKGQLKSVRSQRAATNYVRKGSLNVTESYELFLYRTVEKREKPKSSSSGSSGSRESSGSGSF
jgi:uncharacterized protein